MTLGVILLIIGIIGITDGEFAGIGVIALLLGVLFCWADIKSQQDDEIRHKNDYGKVNRCPKCGSTDVYGMTWDDKRNDVAFWGGASTKIGKRYHCDHCGFEW